MTYRCHLQLQLSQLIHESSLNQTTTLKSAGKMIKTLSRSAPSAPLSAYTPTVPRFYLRPRTPRVPCPRSSPPLRLRGLGELIVGVVYVTPEPSGRVECTSVIVTYPHRGQCIERRGVLTSSPDLRSTLWRKLPRRMAEFPSPSNSLSTGQSFPPSSRRRLEWYRDAAFLSLNCPP